MKTSQESTCIFCNIVSKNIPGAIVYEDESFLAFLDIKPKAPGDTVIIPKSHERWVWDVENIGEYFELVQKIALAQRELFNMEMIRQEVYGEEISHAHVKIWPQLAEDFENNVWQSRNYTKVGMQETANTLRILIEKI